VKASVYNLIMFVDLDHKKIIYCPFLGESVLFRIADYPTSVSISTIDFNNSRTSKPNADEGQISQMAPPLIQSTPFELEKVR